MHKALLGQKLAVLVANGFCEKDLTEMQRALMKTGANVRIVGMDQGLVNSWNENGWGLNFAADQMLSAALGADYSMLVIPGGQRSIDKLKLTAHTRRFIGSFLDSRKPVVAFGQALDLVIFSQRVSGRTVAGPETLKEEAEKAGAAWADDTMAIDGNLMTGGPMASEGQSAEDKSGESKKVDRAAYIAAALDFLTSSLAVDKAA